MSKTREDFYPEVGGFLDDADGSITDAHFEEAGADYAKQMLASGSEAKSAVGLTLTIETPGLERPLTQWYSIGSSDIWQIEQGGREVINKKKPEVHAFRKGSRGMDVVEAMATALGGGDVEKGQDFFIKRDRYMTQADFYIGLNFHWKRRPMPKVGGGTTDVPLPDSYLGDGKVATPGATSTAATGAASTDELDQMVIDLVQGKTEREVKTTAVKDGPDVLKKNTAYMAALVNGSKLKELEDAGKITKGPDEKYI